MLRRLAVGLVLVGLAVTAIAAVAPGTAADTSPPHSQPHPQVEEPLQTTPDGFSSTVFEITVYQNGSARWAIRHIRVLDNDSEVETFRAFAERFERNETDLLQDFRTRADQITAAGSDQTGREMDATAFRKEAYVRERDRNGIVEASFLWTNFARAETDRLVVSDIFSGGMFIREDQRLVFKTGSGLAFEEVVPRDSASLSAAGTLTASESVTWVGEQSFLDRRPYVVYSPTDDNSTLGPADTSNGSETTDDADGSGGTPGDGMMIMAGLLAVLAVVGGLAWYSGVISRTGRDSSPPDGGATTETPSESVQAGAGAAQETETTLPEEELLSDEDRVITMLEENGGRMKQVNIVEQTEWSKSKVSMLLSDMDDDGDISKLRVGRENIISLAGEEPDAAGSPFEDDE